MTVSGKAASCMFRIFQGESAVKRKNQAGTGRQANPKFAFAIFTNTRLAQFWQNCVSESPKLFTVMASMTFYF